jgi:hypothetical protein
MKNIDAAAKDLKYHPHHVESILFQYMRDDMNRAPGAEWPVLDKGHAGSSNQLVSFDDRLERMVKSHRFSMKSKLRNLWPFLSRKI